VTVGFSLDESTTVAAKDAATVILLRDTAYGLEVFFVKRRADIRFMGGAYVFPGGKVDPQDDDLALACDLSGAECAKHLQIDDPLLARSLFVGAARECVEESGILYSKEVVSPAQIAALRHSLDVDKQPFAPLLTALSVTLELSALRPFARWITPRAETRRFDTRFFLARCPTSLDASHDTRETVESCWLRPSDALDRSHRSEIVLVPPTYRTVQILSTVDSVADALALVPESLRPLEPSVRPSEEGSFEILLPDDPEHPQQSPLPWKIKDNVSLVTRFCYADGVWTPRASNAEHAER
jgi:8-oxo-dGTP pyrophosphatase MutT (NUDIX family)